VAHDVALAFQHAADAYEWYASVSKNEVADETVIAETLASEEQQNKLEEKQTHANSQAELFKSVTDCTDCDE
jgi:hypothetical protein